MKAPDSELRRLTDAWHDGTISRGDAVRLEERLLAEPEARDYYLGISVLEGVLPGAAAALPAAQPPPLRKSPGLWWKLAAMFVVGAFSATAVWKLAGSRPVEAVRHSGLEATITGMMGVTWDGNAGIRSLDLRRGMASMRIASGLVEITFGSGTRVVVEGPADFKVTGSNAMDLAFGKAVADVPKGAEGFTIDYAEGRIVDLGTEFGVEIGRNGLEANFGVFRGEIEFHPKADGGKPVRLLENHAVLASPGLVQSVPFDQSKFTRRLPSREFAWEASEAVSGSSTVTWEYDISHLVWKSGRYRAICKWMTGPHGVRLKGAELLLDGVTVASDTHHGFTGSVEMTTANEYNLVVDSGGYRRGTWTLRVQVEPSWVKDDPEVSRGVVLVEDGLALDALPGDFTGTWEYLHDGRVFRRTFHPDGTASLLVNGEHYSAFVGSRWTVGDGSLELVIPNGDHPIIEHHLLRDADTLIFTNRPYRDAARVAE